MVVASSKMNTLGPFVACFYMLTAILLIYFNKAAFHYYAFNAPNLLTLTQTTVSLFFLYTLRGFRWISFQSFAIQRFRRLLPVGLAFLAYMILGMVSMKYVSVPIYTTLRRTTICFVMIFEYYLVNKTASNKIKFAVSLMLLGALIAGLRDLNFDVFSYLLLFGYNFFTAIYLVLINRVTTEEKAIENERKALGEKYDSIQKYDLQYYNNLINLPFLIVIISFTGEWRSFLDSPFLYNLGFQLALFGSSVLAFVLNVAIFWNTAVNSALTQTVSGQAKDIVVIVLGYWAFDDATMDIYSISGVVLGFAGGVYYAIVKLMESAPPASSQSQASSVFPTSSANPSPALANRKSLASDGRRKSALSGADRDVVISVPMHRHSSSSSSLSFESLREK